MDPTVGAGLIGATGSVINGITSFIGGKQATDMSATIARENLNKQLAWEREKATNAYQWAAKDLEKAGFNKNLLNMNAGAAVTGGITPQMFDTSGYQKGIEGLGNTVKDALNTVFAVKTKLAELKNIDAQTTETKSKSALNTALAATEAARKGLISKQTENQIIKNASEQLRLQLDEKYSESERFLGIGKQLTGMARDIVTPLAQMYGFGKLSKGLNKIKKNKPNFKGFKMNKRGDIYNPNTGEVIW